MRRRDRAIIGCVLGCLLIVSGCASLRRAGEGSKYVEGAVGGDLRREILTDLRGREREMQSLKTMATVRYGSRIFGVHGETAIVVKRPFYMRLDGISDFGQYDSQVSLTRGDLTIYWSGEDLYYKGLASPDSLGRFLQVTLLPEAALDLVMGLVPLEDEAEYRVRQGKKEGTWILTGQRGEITAGRENGRFVPYAYAGLGVNGKREAFFEFMDYRTEGRSLFSHRRRIRFLHPSSKLEVDFHGVELNPKVRESVFELSIPSHAKRLQD